MARYELTAPDGAKYEITAPDSASEQEVQSIFAKQIGGQSRDQRMASEADQTIKQREQDSPLYQMTGGWLGGEGTNVAEGIPIIGGWLDELGAYATSSINQGLETLTGNKAGETDYEKALALERAKSRRATENAPVMDTAAKLAAGIATGGPLARAFASPTTMGSVARGVAVGGPLGYAEGFSRGEGGFENRNESGMTTAPISAGIGAALPIAGAGAQRAFGAYQDYVQPGITRMRSGPEAAADEILANRIYREGSSPQAKRLELQQGQRSARFDSNSRADLPETIADTSDAMQRLTGSAYRAGGEAGNEIRRSIMSRQRGADNPYTNRAPRPTESSSQGQRGRIFDGVRRALLVRSRDGAAATRRQIENEQRQVGNQLYRQAYDNSDPFDLDPAILTMGLRLNEHTGAHRAQLQRALDLFVQRGVPGNPSLGTVRRFDAAKKQLDDMIEAAGRAGSSNLRRQLVEFKDELLQQVHQGGRNPIYQQARDAWGSAAERREAVELGQRALRDDSEVTLDTFNNLTSGQQALFRIGVVDATRRMMGSKRPGDDLTRIFQQNRVQELMNGIIPRSQRSRDVFADRAQRFGDVMQREQRMVQTNNRVLGGSPTAQRVQDDAEFAGETLSRMWDKFRQSPGILNMAMEGVGYGIQQIFGYRQDVALALARRLLETDRTAQNQILRRLLARGGPDRFTRFMQMTDETSRALQSSVPAALAAGGAVRIGDGER